MSGFIDDFFEGIEKDILAAGIKKSISDYIKDAKLYSISIGFSFAIFSFFILLILLIKVIGQFNIFIPLIFSIFFGFLGFFFGLFFFRNYPKLVKSERERKINNSLYYAVLYMASLASSGVNPKSIFELLSKYNEFSEIKKEAEEIIYYVDTLGLSLPLALKRKAEYSPSREWSSILEGIRSIIVEGGDLEKYLYEQARRLAEEYKRKIIEYSNNLQIFLEIYITLIVVGIIFVIILTTLMGSIAGTNSAYIESLQLMSILLLLPLGTILFVILLKSMNPFET
jgi:flagellar protein FlaJ